MPEKGTWRIAAAYDYVSDLDAPDLAWEFLRRNSEYQQDYARLTDSGHSEEQASIVLREKWGLSFRGRSPYPVPARQRTLDTSGRPIDPDPTQPPDRDCTTAIG